MTEKNTTPEFARDIWENLAKWLHKQKNYDPKNLADPEPLAAIRETHRILSQPLQEMKIGQEIPEELTAALNNNIFYFSGFKTHHELVQASRMLKDSDGNFKPFHKFLNDIETLNKTYNKNYLRAEYNFATASTQMAVKWKEWEQDEERYNLQYRTAGDDRVREEHAALNGVTLPPSDPFWNSYLPPNGWNCRCTTVQVRKNKYPQSNSEKAMAAGAACTAKPKQQIFRFNPGKQEKIFPPKHPYFPKGCGDCQYRQLSYNPESAWCQACQSIGKCISMFKTKRELENITAAPGSNRRAFRQLKKESERRLKSEGNFYDCNKRFYTQRMYFAKDEKEAVMAHCFDGVEAKAAEKLQQILPTLSNGKYVPLDMSRANYKQKIADGVLHFTAYEVEVDGETFVLKCEAIKDPNNKHGKVIEHPYSFKKKRT